MSHIQVQHCLLIVPPDMTLPNTTFLIIRISHRHAAQGSSADVLFVADNIIKSQNTSKVD